MTYSQTNVIKCLTNTQRHHQTTPHCGSFPADFIEQGMFTKYVALLFSVSNLLSIGNNQLTLV